MTGLSRPRKFLIALLGLLLLPLAAGAAEQGSEADYLARLDGEGWQSTPGGVRYRVLKAAPGGASPSIIDTALLHYRGSLRDGKVFEDTLKSGKPVKIQLTRTIGGWREVVPMMKLGEEWEIVVPARFGYGARGSSSGKVPPDATLLFTIQLLGFTKPQLSGQS